MLAGKLVALVLLATSLVACSNSPAELTAEERAAAERDLVVEVHEFDGLIDGIEYLDDEWIVEFGYVLCSMVEMAKDDDNSALETRMLILQSSGGGTGTLDGATISKVVALSAGLTVCPEHVEYIAEMFA